jgi:EmrB/QacA subfamily drug resistance transporter
MSTTRSFSIVVPLIVACALFMENLDSTIIATALPVIAKSLHEDPVRLNLAITSYLLSLAVFIPLSGWVADRYGARQVFRAAIAVFTLGSICCGFADSLTGLVAARIVQGMGGAMMVPVGRLVLLRTVPKAELVTAMSFLTMPALLGPVSGPPLGGFIVTYFSWRWIFFVNVPMGILGIYLASRFVSDIKEPNTAPLDLWGFIFSGVGLAGLVYGFEMVGRGAVGPEIVAALLIGGATFMTLYGFHARRTAHPIIDLALFKIPTFSIAILGGFIFRVGIGAVPFLLPLMLQIGFGLSPLTSGLLTFASAAGALTMKAAAGPIIRAVGFRRILVTNSVIGGLFLISYGLFGPSTPHALIFVALLAGGFFRSLQFTSTNTLTYADVPAPLMSRATSIASMAQQLALSLGVGTGAMLLHIILTERGGTGLVAQDFAPAFWIVGLISLASVLLFARLAPAAGADLIDRRAKEAAPVTKAAE